MVKFSAAIIVALSAIAANGMPLTKRIDQIISDSTTQWVAACNAAGGGAQCSNISVTAFTTLLAAAGPCDQQNSADAMVDLAKTLNNNADMIKFAQIFAQQPRNSPTSQAVPYCQQAPKNAELNGLFQCQFQSVDEKTFVGGVAVGGAGTIPFGQSSPLSPRARALRTPAVPSPTASSSPRSRRPGVPASSSAPSSGNSTASSAPSSSNSTATSAPSSTPSGNSTASGNNSASGNSTTPANCPAKKRRSNKLNRRIAQVIADSTTQWVQACNTAGGGAQCSSISVTAFTTLLAAAGPCDQQNSADAMINLAKTLNNNADMIKFAQIFAQQPRNSPTSQAVPYCQQAPKNTELNGLFQCQFQSADEKTFVGGVAVGGAGTIPFGQSSPLSPAGSCPANPSGPIPDGQQLVSITQVPIANGASASNSTGSAPLRRAPLRRRSATRRKTWTGSDVSKLDVNL
ncbi:hypothetical protein A0H81_14698 [Grifola frondosa]|uniref:Uncharacterized protein n=1 Tax=Grifola frondosa TaxID=5627 RepID=A0A1C7LMQ6_GRIFR|nr:hypothetical protein A0H81_14698 [Grifola frondosa]